MSATGPLRFALDQAISRALDHALGSPPAATPAALRALAADLDALGHRVSGMTDTLATLQAVRGRIATLRSSASPASDAHATQRLLRSRDESLEATLLSVRDRIRAVADALSGADQRARDAVTTAASALALARSAAATVEGLHRGPASAPTAGASPEPDPASTAGPTCRVAGCDGAIKARHLCSRHYGRWYRGRLDGWVGSTGEVKLPDGSRWRVDRSLAALPAERVGEELHVDGRAVDARSVR